MSLRPTPATIDPEIWKTGYAVLSGNFGDPGHDLHCLEDLVSFCRGQIAPDPQENVPVLPPLTKQTLSKEEVLAVVKALSEGQKMAGSVPWLAILQALWQAFLAIIGGLPAGS